MKRTEDRYFRISLLVLVPWICLKHPHVCCCTSNYSKMYMQLIFHIICKNQSVPAILQWVRFLWSSATPLFSSLAIKGVPTHDNYKLQLRLHKKQDGNLYPYTSATAPFG